MYERWRIDDRMYIENPWPLEQTPRRLREESATRADCLRVPIGFVS